MDPILRLSATEQLAMLRERRISAPELAELHLSRIQALNPIVNALIDFDAERVRQQLRDPHPGPLSGLPVTVKSTVSVAGHRCELGSQLHRGEMSRGDSVVVSRLRRAGAVILGTTNNPEFLMAYETDNLLYGRTSNPWNLEYSAGGSSGGESAAIAACMSAAGLGSDSGGSVRQPAHATGICALKPTPGRIPGAGHDPACVGPFATLGAVGPMARTIADVQLLFDVLSGHDQTDPASAPVPLRRHSSKELKTTPIGFFEDDGLCPVTMETRAAVHAAADALRRDGFDVRPFRPRALEAARKLWWTFFVRCGGAIVDGLIKGRESEISPTLAGFLEIAHHEAPLDGGGLLADWCAMQVIQANLLDDMQQFPVLLCPVSSVPAFRHGERSWQIDGQEVLYLDAMRYTQWFNLLGAPAAVVPVALSSEGLPIGVQLVARPYHDELALAVAGVVDRAFGYRYPQPLDRAAGVASPVSHAVSS
jgi:Asp-tRNA(Asn)/Glu-tRNA(Gln) amidotransferase A subunit family amidase